MNKRTGILLTNTGTPNAPTQWQVARYLAEFLTDKRVIKIPRSLWYPLLYGWILPVRSWSSARLYRSIWRPDGSPLAVHMHHIAEKLSLMLNQPVAVGMNYGRPSIGDALKSLEQQNIQDLVILPLFPQYSGTSTASSFDRAMQTLQRWENLPHLRFIRDYADHPLYIDALCSRILGTWQQSGKKFLLASFHGIPERYAADGDPYPTRCRLTMDKIAHRLQLKPHEYSMAFQSRIGPAGWLSPYTDHVLKTLPGKGITDIQVICPGFASDCLETLEEIVIRGRHIFLQHGGKNLEYIPALNASLQQIQLLATLCAGEM